MWFCFNFFYVSVIIPHIMMQNRPISCLLNIITKTPRKRRPVELNNGFMFMWFLMRCLTFNFNLTSYKSLAIQKSPLSPPPVAVAAAALPFIPPFKQLIAFVFFFLTKARFSFCHKKLWIFMRLTSYPKKKSKLFPVQFPIYFFFEISFCLFCYFLYYTLVFFLLLFRRRQAHT